MRKLLFVLCGILVIMITSTSAWCMGSKPERPYCETDYPIILVPGVVGFDSLIGMVDYFYGVADSLEKDGAVVYAAALTGWAGTEERGDQLIAFIDTVKASHPEYTKFNVIAHSHGSTTSRYAMKNRPELFASLTTIAGPHQGTPVADYANEEISDDLKTVGYAGIELLTGDFIALISGHKELIGTQDIAACIEHFTKDGMESFNNEYPCAGVPAGATKGSYGDDADTINGSFYGDGLGNPDGGIRYYSWTGNAGTGSVTSLDLLDAVMGITNLFIREYGYTGDADAFIPVASSHFGEVINDTYHWNHVDEINHTLGVIDPFAANPVSVFRQHANRLQKAGF